MSFISENKYFSLVFIYYTTLPINKDAYMQSKESRYEICILAVPEITQDEVKDVEKQLSDLLEKIEGSLISFEKWGKYHLEYPVNKNRYGVYMLSRFKIKNPEKSIEEIKNLMVLRFESIVIRNIITLLEDNDSLEYQRPRSLEEIPPEDIDFTFQIEIKELD